MPKIHWQISVSCCNHSVYGIVKFLGVIITSSPCTNRVIKKSKVKVQTSVPVNVASTCLTPNMTLEAIRYKDGKLEILDQLLLPHETKFIPVKNTQDGWTVIKTMQVKKKMPPKINIGRTIWCSSRCCRRSHLILQSRLLYSHMCYELIFKTTIKGI